MKVVVITGSRVFPWRRSSEIQKVLEGADLLIVGDAKGADAIARKLAARAFIPVLECKADWGRHGLGAGPRRNALMVGFAAVFMRAGYKSVECHAFPFGESRGTRGCVDLMKSAGIPVVVHEDPEA